MNTSRFVSGSSIILAGWLGATFLNEVPSQRYPKLDKKPTTAAVEADSPTVILATHMKPVSPTDSLSR